jgi:hypothetical protein
MMRHLSRREVVDAVEETLDAARRRHLETCERCRRQVVELSGVLGSPDLRSDVPEPSPLFWDGFQARVRDATANEPLRPRSPWWAWAALAAAAPAAAVAVLLVAMNPSWPDPVNAVARVPVPASPVIRPEPLGAAGGGRATPTIAMDTTADRPSAALPQLADPPLGSADSLLEDLTTAERAELLRLLKAEMGGGA